jgi:hypothetical protein
MTANDRREIAEVIGKAVSTAMEMHRLGCPIREVQTQTESNTDGVNNFRKFQIDVTAKMNFVHGAAKAWSWILGLAFTGILSLAIWGFLQIYPALRAIMVEYYSHHPAAMLDNPKNTGQVTQAHNQTQDVQFHQLQSVR